MPTYPGAGRRQTVWTAFAVAACLFSISGWTKPSSADLAIINAIVISPPHEPVSGQTILIRDGRINYVGPPVKFESARTIDARHRYVMPGLIDVHTHLALQSFDDDATYWKWADTQLQALLLDYLSHGFTTILSVGDYWPNIASVRDKVNGGESAHQCDDFGCQLLEPGGGSRVC